MTKTTELAIRFDYLVSSAILTSIDYPKGLTWLELRIELLKACKEAGLKFVHRNWDGEHAHGLEVEEVEIDS